VVNEACWIAAHFTKLIFFIALGDGFGGEFAGLSGEARVRQIGACNGEDTLISGVLTMSNQEIVARTDELQ